MLPVFERPPCSPLTLKFLSFIHFAQTGACTEEHEKYTQNVGGKDNGGNQGADEKLIQN